MITAKTIEQARAAVQSARLENKTIAFVPTMGSLHDGHLSLLEIAKQHCGYAAMSIFVNKIQFNDASDFEKYPRDYKKDLDLISANGCSLAFLPDDSIMYNDPHTYVVPDYLDEYLCGAARPGHFRGVCTVVLKLFNIIQPDIAVFGQKDIQQCAILSKMIDDLNIPVKMIIAPIKRDNNGLALSSRNALLSDAEKKNALSIIDALRHAEVLMKNGERSSAVLIGEIKKIIASATPAENIDYISIVDFTTLHPADQIRGKCIIACAAYFGKTRLIDNMIIEETGDTVLCR